MTHNISLRFGADSGVKNGEKVVVKMLYFTDFIERSIEFQDSTPDSNNISLKLHKTKEYSAKIELEISDPRGNLLTKPKDDEILIVMVQNRKSYNQSIKMNDGRLITITVGVSKAGLSGWSNNEKVKLN